MKQLERWWKSNDPLLKLKWQLEVVSIMTRNNLLFIKEDMPLHNSLTFTQEVNSLINGKGLMLPSSYNESRWLTFNSNRINVPKYYVRNKFLLSSMMGIGGGAIGQLQRALRKKRFGGSTQDKINYLSTYNNENVQIEFEFKVSLDRLAFIVSGNSNTVLTVCSGRKTLTEMKYNHQASAGSIHGALGFVNKEESIFTDNLMFRIQHLHWCLSASKGTGKRSELWNTASRPKLFNAREKISKIRKFFPCSRAISFASPLEALCGMPLFIPVKYVIEQQFKDNHRGIAIGCNRLGKDWPLMAKIFNNSKFIYVGDYSRFDQSVPSILLERAFELIFSFFSKEEECTVNYISNYKCWLENNYYKRTQHIDGQVLFELSGGIPSGTIWTSVLGSFCNIIIIEEFKLNYGYDQVEYLVYGDDHVLVVNEEIDDKLFKDQYEEFVLEKFGMVLSPDDSYITRPEEYFVTYKRPVYKPGQYLSGGTSKLKPVKYQFKDSPFDEFDYDQGTTHRWSYVFSKRVKFLQYYWLKSGVSIRPWPENLVRMLNPEQEVKTIEDCEMLYTSHLIDNFNNAHARNWIYHLSYDLSLIKRLNWRDKLIWANLDLYGCKGAYLSFKENRGLYGEGGLPRYWYRKIDHYVNLRTDLRMERFNVWWDELYFKISDILGLVKHESTFKKRNILTMFEDKRRSAMYETDKVDEELRSVQNYCSNINEVPMFRFLILFNLLVNDSSVSISDVIDNSQSNCGWLRYKLRGMRISELFLREVLSRMPTEDGSQALKTNFMLFEQYIVRIRGNYHAFAEKVGLMACGLTE